MGEAAHAGKKLDDIMEKRRNFCELWVLYDPTRRLGRRVSFASDTKETCFLSLPCPRTHLAVQTRESFNRLGEATTHDSTYSGVEPFAWGAVPRCTLGIREPS